MKFLLTSAGITNNKIAQAVVDLVGIPKGKIRLVFIPTAANVEEGDKDWLINDLLHFKEQGYESIDIMDIAAVPQKVWQPRIEAANLICFGGGNAQYLAKAMLESGLSKILPDLLKTRIYMGISAGSMVVGEFITPDQHKVIYPDEEVGKNRESAFGLVNCTVIPHLNSPYFPTRRKEILETIKGLKAPFYALDDDSALEVEDGEIEVIGEGKYLVL